LYDKKKLIRIEALAARNLLKKEEVEYRSRIISKKLEELDGFNNSNLVMCYLDFKNEVITGYFIEKCLKSGKRVAVPKVFTTPQGQREILASEIYDVENDLEKGFYGILEPKIETTREIDPGEIDLAVIPGTAFDMSGNRIGYGAGFYDRFLKRVKRNCLKVGVAFDLQIYEHVPADQNDIPMDIIITENRVIIDNRKPNL